MKRVFVGVGQNFNMLQNSQKFLSCHIKTTPYNRSKSLLTQTLLSRGVFITAGVMKSFHVLSSLHGSSIRAMSECNIVE